VYAVAVLYNFLNKHGSNLVTEYELICERTGRGDTARMEASGLEVEAKER
jgi:hypothetical protein